MGVIGFLDRLAGRFNRWFGPAALASSIEQQQAGTAPSVSPVGVVAALGRTGGEAA
jgi:hypothetical protein